MNNRFVCLGVLTSLLILAACKNDADVVVNKPSAPFGSVADAIFGDEAVYVLLRDRDEILLVQLGESGIERRAQAQVGENLSLGNVEVLYLYERGRPKPLLRHRGNIDVEIDVSHAAQRIPESISPDRVWFVVGLPGLENTEAVLVNLHTGHEHRLGVGGGKRVQWTSSTQFVVLDASLRGDPAGFAGFGHARPILYEVLTATAGGVKHKEIEQQEMLGYRQIAVGWDGATPLEQARFALLDPEGTDSVVMPGGFRIDGPGVNSLRAIGIRLWFIGDGKLWAVPFDATDFSDISILKTESSINDYVISVESDGYSVCVMQENGVLSWYQFVDDVWRVVASDSVGME